MNAPIRAAILTVSDRCARGEAEDLSGPALADAVRERLGGVVVARECVPDEPAEIRAWLRRWAAHPEPIDLVLTTGGTGLSPRDQTPEAAAAVFDRLAPGLMELARARTGKPRPRAFLSRGVAGTIARTLVITLPGSPGGAVEMFEALASLLPHAVETLRDEESDHAGG